MDVQTVRRAAPLVFGAVVVITLFLARDAFVTVAIIGGVLLGLLYALTSGGGPGSETWSERRQRRERRR